MPATRPIVALLTALAVLLSLPVASSQAGKGDSKSTSTHQRKAGKHRKHKRKHARKHGKKHKKHKPQAGKKKRPTAPADADALDSVGAISAVDGDFVTIVLTKGGTLTGRVTEDTVLICPGDDQLADDDADTADEPGDDGFDTDDDGDDDGEDGDVEDLRSARTGSACAPTVGAPVYEAEVDEGVYDVLDLNGE